MAYNETVDYVCPLISFGDHQNMASRYLMTTLKIMRERISYLEISLVPLIARILFI
jgi:hypothetical protein